MRWQLLSLVFMAFVLWRAESASQAAPPDIADTMLTIKVRAVLYQDPELRPYNIGVRVKDRVAFLFGPVPKMELGLRAEGKLRDVFELREIRLELDVLDPLPELPPIRIPSPAPRPGQESPFRPAGPNGRPSVPVGVGVP
jgi:hypothetical protein